VKRLLRASVAGSVLAIGACAAQKSAPREPVTATKKNEAAPASMGAPATDSKTGTSLPEPYKEPPPPPTVTPDPSAGGTGNTPPGVDVPKKPTATPVQPPPPVTPTAPPTTTSPPGVKPTPVPGPSTVGVAQAQFDDADKAFVGASGCPAMCKALDSLKNAADHLCALSKSSEPKRCGDAQAKVQKATAKVKSMCGGCGSP